MFTFSYLLTFYDISTNYLHSCLEILWRMFCAIYMLLIYIIIMYIILYIYIYVAIHMLCIYWIHLLPFLVSLAGCIFVSVVPFYFLFIPFLI